MGKSLAPLEAPREDPPTAPRAVLNERAPLRAADRGCIESSESRTRGGEQDLLRITIEAVGGRDAGEGRDACEGRGVGELRDRAKEWRATAGRPATAERTEDWRIGAERAAGGRAAGRVAGERAAGGRGAAGRAAIQGFAGLTIGAAFGLLDAIIRGLLGSNTGVGDDGLSSFVRPISDGSTEGAGGLQGEEDLKRGSERR